MSAGAGPKTAAANAAPTRQQPAPRRREIASVELFAGAREIDIRHADEVYTLRQTSKGKLILTK